MDIETVTTSGRKTTRRKTTGTATRAARKTTPTEILFDQEPTPYRDPVPPYIWIDFPTQNEQLRGPQYVVRLGVGGETNVEMSINKSVWKPCRLTSGYWWYDWSGIARGKHTLVARMRTADGRWYRTPPRVCEFR